jgi:hypothetical protein
MLVEINGRMLALFNDYDSLDYCEDYRSPERASWKT